MKLLLSLLFSTIIALAHSEVSASISLFRSIILLFAMTIPTTFHALGWPHSSALSHGLSPLLISHPLTPNRSSSRDIVISFHTFQSRTRTRMPRVVASSRPASPRTTSVEMRPCPLSMPIIVILWSRMNRKGRNILTAGNLHLLSLSHFLDLSLLAKLLNRLRDPTKIALI